MTDDSWNGIDGTSEHRTVGGRAWCYQDAEWCYPHSLCPCCDQTRVPERWRGMTVGEVLIELRAEVTKLLAMQPRYEVARRAALNDVLALIEEAP